ncbi:5-oxoprolinase subunit PxpB [Aquisalibacillus elongatus]|uniref:Inhibitor of KinA n=1 Tax=Aquisalibacillus elongatus TaxID=485577 RepID=A0A3N5B9I9_9BACI|nr:5-oxoprolinase subunit PxpB [Aquisalibacillus elongatus]RPF52140.1 inhibitor of KinA [Aquisalibacillus elongatus]
MQKIFPLNDQSITVSFGDVIDLNINRNAQQLYRKILELNDPYIIDVVPTYTNVTVFFNHKLISYNEMEDKLKGLIEELTSQSDEVKTKIIHIPVYYDGPDLERVAQYNHITTDEVIKRHVDGQYQVYMIGFLPGFPYLGGLDEQLATPRLNQPRPKTPAGSVGIANHQTGIYSVESPGGWNIIGYTPISIFDLEKEQPFLFQAGDVLKFYEISKLQLDEGQQPEVEWLDENY